MQIIDIVSEDYGFCLILVKSKSTAVKIQSSSEHHVKFSKLFPALFSIGHPAGAPKNICSEDDLRSRIFGTFVVKFLACLPLLGHLEVWGAFLLAEIFEKVSFDPYNFRITGLSARKSKQMKNF